MRRRELLIKIILLVFCGILFTYHLGTALPIIESEKFYFQSVKEMFARHDFITPYYQGRFRFQKPILFYWLVSASYAIFGIDNFGVRFPSAIFGMLTVIFTFNIGRRLFDRKTGFLAAGILATIALFFMYARYASPDMVLTFFVAYSMYLFLKGSKSMDGGRRFFIFFFIVLGLATLNKGYVGFALPLIIVLLFVCSTKKWKLLKSMNLPMGFLIILAIGLPWYIVMYKLHGQKYLDHIVVRETMMRMFYAPDNEKGLEFVKIYFKRILYYIPILAGWLAPYSLFLPQSIFDAFRSKNTYSREKDSYKLVLSYFFGIFLFFTVISVKEYHYMLPIAPALALLVARYLINLQERGALFKSWGFRIPFFLIVIVYILTLVILLYTMNHLYPNTVAFYEYAILFSPLILIVPYMMKRKKMILAAIPIAMGILMAFLGGRAIPLLNDNTMRGFAEEIERELREGDRVGVGSMNISQQRLSIYLDKRIDEPNVRWKKGYDPKGLHQSRLTEFMNSGSDVYLVISRQDYETILPDELRVRLNLMDNRKTWKTRLKRSFGKDVILQILRGEKDILKDVLRHEIYLLTSKELTIAK
ncbi:MAG: glycosyltransferase family 39 protein [Candidatus Omnitrophica bacterium]|nr:glycosyltransferase family 39 protein [Candidatus Omnitrophota bacterium]